MGSVVVDHEQKSYDACFSSGKSPGRLTVIIFPAAELFNSKPMILTEADNHTSSDILLGDTLIVFAQVPKRLKVRAFVSTS